MSAKKKTAVLIIHGIGDQEPFETLDALAGPLVQALERSAPGAALEKTHSLMRFPDWIDSCISITAANCDERGGLDLHEYYWSHKTQRQISALEVWEWIVDVGRGAKAFYSRQRNEMEGREKNDELFTRDGEFKNYEYLARLLSRWKILRFLYRLASPFLFRIQWVGKILGQLAAAPLENYLGDVTIYCSTNKKSRHFEVRSRILNGAYEKLTSLINNDEYSRVVLMGHSLGTVVAYDALAKLNRELNVSPEKAAQAAKICGLVTFGSPLDKIAFFFDEQIPKDQAYRKAIISQLYGFKRKNVDTVTLTPGMKQYFEDLKWFNFWAQTDPVSGHLDVYRGVTNIEMDFTGKVSDGLKGSLESHCAYWDSAEMYQKIIDEFALCGLDVTPCEAGAVS